MSINCTFHRLKAAHFQCYECGSTFCEDCISVRITNGYSSEDVDYFCPGCNVPAEMMSLGNMIAPFWNKLGSFFLYPFQLTPLFLTLLLAGLGALFPSNSLVNLFVWVVMMKYAYATLIETGKGSLRAPVLTWGLINKDVMQVFKQYLIFAIIGFVVSMAFRYGGGLAGFPVMVTMILALPAIIMLLVATNSVVHALNPVLFIGIISRIGSHYFLMYIFLMLLLAGPAALFAYVPQSFMPMPVYVFLSLFIQQFYALICYRLLGYVLLQYHQEIGYHVDYNFFMQNRGKGQKRKKQKPEDDLKNGLSILVKQGKYEEALKLLYPFIKDERPSIELSEKFLQLLKLAGNHEEASSYSIRHLSSLIEQKKKKKALTLFNEMKTDDTKIDDGETVFTVGNWYTERREFKQAISTCIYFTKHCKNHSREPDVYFNLAQLLNEHTNNSSKAREILNAILKSYPQHALIPEVQRYLTSIV